MKILLKKKKTYIEKIIEINNNGNLKSKSLEAIENISIDKEETLHKIQELIVKERLLHFEPMLASFGYNLHLITLPEFHVLSYNMYNLSKDFSKNGIYAYVSHVQRPERLLHELDTNYTYYKHQSATGTGIEATFSSMVGSSDNNILSASTEADDLENRRS